MDELYSAPLKKESPQGSSCLRGVDSENIWKEPKEMNPILRVTVLGVLLCLLVCVHSRAVPSDRWSALDLPANREAFLSALQSYFSGKGIHIDRTAPAFLVLSTKTQEVRNPGGYGKETTARGRHAYDSEKDVEQGEFY
ncbi:uncharacterized protein C2orf66-like [Ambystoma mexicanum]|uniref:uncharacterized protein C2orf66-like n=1 Tax=Ambystoma mexicanum TaxID=8296 RepID=UPI0037E6FB41